MEHTKGEWEVSKGIDGAVIYEPDTGTVASVPMDLQGWEANAQLIAAAPDLYDALLLYIDDCEIEELEYNDDAYKAAKKAIAKADGK